MANQTMNNMELSRAVEILNQQYTGLNNRFNNVIPEMTNHITQSSGEITAMYEAIKSDIQPVIDRFTPLKTGVEKAHAEAIEEYQKIVRLGENTNKRFEDTGNHMAAKTSAMEASINTMKDTLQQMAQKFGVDSQSRVEMEVKNDQIGAKLDALMIEVEYAKKTHDNNYQTTQMQIATAISTMSSGPGMATSSGSREPLATHKLMMGEAKINGSESSAVLDDWFELIAMKVNLIDPGGNQYWIGVPTMRERSQHLRFREEATARLLPNSQCGGRLTQVEIGRYDSLR